MVALSGVGMAAGAIGQVISRALDRRQVRLANIRQSYNRLATDWGPTPLDALRHAVAKQRLSQAELMERYSVGGAWPARR